MLYYKMETNDPAVNLATEEYLFNTVEEDMFMIWQNRPCVVIGQYQNAYEEIDMDILQQTGIAVIRRMTGGGAVYHDMGNINYTFIHHGHGDDRFEFGRFMKKITDAISAVGVDARINGRNDITVDGKKVSGNAQYISGKRVLHHGTLLFDSDLAVLSMILKQEDRGIDSKAEKSARQRVTNIRKYLLEDMSVESFYNAISSEILKNEDVHEMKTTAYDKRQIMKLVGRKYGSWEWNIGASPKCRILRKGIWDQGRMSIQMDVQDGVIAEFHIEGDFFADDAFRETIRAFTGCKFDRASLESAVEQCAASIYGMESEMLMEWIISGNENFLTRLPGQALLNPY